MEEEQREVEEAMKGQGGREGEREREDMKVYCLGSMFFALLRHKSRRLSTRTSRPETLHPTGPTCCSLSAQHIKKHFSISSSRPEPHQSEGTPSTSQLCLLASLLEVSRPGLHRCGSFTAQLVPPRSIRPHMNSASVLTSDL